MGRILVTGAGGAIGAMAKRHFDASGLAWQDAALRASEGPAVPAAGCATLLHLANVARDVNANMALQRRVARLIEASGVRTVIVPQSYSTLARIGPHGAGPDRFNFGMLAAMNDPYPRGKLAVESFWCDWQAARPHMRLVFAYVPVIVGPDSQWSALVRKAGRGRTLLVPRIARFFMVRQHELLEGFARIHRAGMSAGMEPGIERQLMATQSPSLAQAVAPDFPGAIEEWEVGAPVRALCALAERFAPADRALLAATRIAQAALPRLSDKVPLGLSAKYLALFLRQEALGAEPALMPARGRLLALSS